MITMIEKQKIEEMEKRIKELEQKENMLNLIMEKYERVFISKNPYEAHDRISTMICYVNAVWEVLNGKDGVFITPES